MGCAFISLVLFCFVICLQGFVYCEDTNSRDMTIRNQLFADVYLLKEGVDRLQISMDVLNKKYSSQADLLNKMHSQIVAEDIGDGTCDKIPNILNDTLRNYYLLEDQMVTKLEQIQQEQELSYNKMQLKLDKLTNQMHRFNILEEHLIQQQTQMETFMDSQKKMLQELKDDILKTQDKLNSVDERPLTQFNEWSQHFGEFIPKKPTKVSMDVIRGLGQTKDIIPKSN